MAAPPSQVASVPTHKPPGCQCDPGHQKCHTSDAAQSSLTSAADSPTLLPPPPLRDDEFPSVHPDTSLHEPEEEKNPIADSLHQSDPGSPKKRAPIESAPAAGRELAPNEEEPLIPDSMVKTKKIKEPPKPSKSDRAGYGGLDPAYEDRLDKKLRVASPPLHEVPPKEHRKKSSRKERADPGTPQPAASTPARRPMGSKKSSRKEMLSPQLVASPSRTSDPEQPKKTHPSLEEEAKLSIGPQLVDWGYRSFWWGVSLPKRLMSWSVNKGVEKLTSVVLNAAAHKGVELLAPPEPDTPLKVLWNCLYEISEKVSKNVPIDPSLKGRSIAAVSDFLARQQNYLNESINPNGLREGLNYQQQRQFQVLLEALKDSRPLTTTFVKPLYEFINKCWEYQKQFHTEKKAQQLLGQAQQPTRAAASAAQPTKEKKELPLAPLPEPTEKPPKQNPIPLIVKEIDQLKSLGFKIALALVILPESRLQQRQGESGSLIADLIKKANETLDPLKDSNEIFQGLISNELDISDLNFFQRTWKKLSCKLLAPVILFMIDHLLEKSKETVLYLIGLPPEERMNMIIKIFIEPCREFIGKLHGEYLVLRDKPNVGTTVDRAISDAITNIKIEDRHGKMLTPKDLINRLVGAFIDQFAPAFNWPSVAMAHFKTQAAQTTPPLQLLWVALSFFSWMVNIISGPVRWGMHRIVRKIVKMIAVSNIHAKLQDTSEASWDFGRLSLQSLYKTLYTKLYKQNRAAPGSATDDAQKKLVIEQAAFVDKNVQSNIHQLLAGFYKLLSLQGLDLIDLRKKFDLHTGLKQTVDEGMDWVINQALDKATEGLIQGLQNFLADESFSTGLSEVLSDIRQQCQSFNTRRDDGNFNRLESDFFVELQVAIERGLNAVIEEDPSKRMQEEANLFIDGVKHDIATFQEQWDLLADLTQMDKLKKDRDKYLIDGLEHRRKRAEAQTQTSPSAHDQIETVVGGFSTLRTPLYQGIDRLITQTQGLRKIEDQMKELVQLEGPLRKAIRQEPLDHATVFYHPLQLTLQLIKNKSYPPKVQPLISNIQGNFEAWTTEQTKRDNQTLLNSSILALLEAVTDAHHNLTEEHASLTATIGKTVGETEDALKALVAWSEKLHHFICTVPQQKISLIKESFSRYVQGQLPSLILKQLQTFFIFLGKNHNVKGLLWYVVKSYLELPTKSPQKLKEIIDKVKLQLEEPLSAEMPPQ